MPRRRDLKPGFFTNEDLAACSPHARLLFAGLWCWADREGRLEDRPARIRGEVFPYEPNLDCDALLVELTARGFIQRYRTRAGSYIQITNFAKHQHPHPREMPSTYPEPQATPRRGRAVPRSGLGTAQAIPSPSGSSCTSGSSGSSCNPHAPAARGPTLELRDHLCAAWREVEPVPDGPTWSAADWTQLARLHRRVGEQRIREAWSRFLADPWPPGHPLRVFCGLWDRWATTRSSGCPDVQLGAHRPREGPTRALTPKERESAIAEYTRAATGNPDREKADYFRRKADELRQGAG